MKKATPCNLCFHNRWSKFYSDLIKCSHCGLIKSDKKYFRFNTKLNYDQKYFKGQDYYDYLLEQPAVNKNAANRLKIISKYKKRGHLLDIGCAYGFFLKQAKIFGFKPEGWDVNPKITSTAKNISKCPTHYGTDITKSKIKQNWDIITMFDVIEHLKHPEKYIQKCFKLLKPGGIIILETGNISALLPKIQKDKWRLISPAIHLFYFSDQTLIQMLVKYGFKIMQVKNVGFWRSINQILFRTNSKLFKYIPNIFKTLPIYLNTQDLILVIAQK